ncbi:MAG: hypothetical protein KVP17_004776 [Porospora cf. gigantea B]|uniref:uncharacterized protein n=1 Tax=Porospora cf. gigantea B TaxID=2853592 RepID=UPI003571C49B|nr:MAG: hypothetical protein KVP17_004776 [Porospora cf. gigantea B]
MVDSNEDRVADQEYHPRAYSGMSDADLIWATRYFQAPAPYGGVAFRGDSSDPSMELKRLSKLLKALTARKRFEEKQLGEVQAALCLELADFPVIDVGQDRRHSLRVGAAIGILLRLQRRPQRQVRVFWRNLQVLVASHRQISAAKYIAVRALVAGLRSPLARVYDTAVWRWLRRTRD